VILQLLLLLLATTSTTTLALNLWGNDNNSEVASDTTTTTTDAAAQAQAQHNQPINSFSQPTYGVDISFPIHHTSISTNYAWLPHNNPHLLSQSHPTPSEYQNMPIQYLGNKQAEYDAMIDACEAHYSSTGPNSVCKITEADRVEMSKRQPASMQNYTELGFKKIKAPPEVWAAVQQFWKENKDRSNWKEENWPRGNTYTNHVSTSVRFVSGNNIVGCLYFGIGILCDDICCDIG
jgi:hypothetical protein